MFYSVITDQRRIANPLSPLKAQEIFEDYLKLPFRIIVSNQETIKILSMFCQKKPSLNVNINVKKILDKYADRVYHRFIMLNISTITTRDILRNYREIFDKVKKTKQPAVVFVQKEPQVAIVSLDDLERLKILKNIQSTKALLDLAGIIPKGSGLPADLSEKHDEYTWD